MSDVRRVERLPRSPRACAFPSPCVYRENGVCDDPWISNGNSDAACHKVTRWKINAALSQPATQQGSDRG